MYRTLKPFEYFEPLNTTEVIKILNKYKTPEGYTLVGIIDFNFDDLFQNTDYKGGTRPPRPPDEIIDDINALMNFWRIAFEDNNYMSKTKLKDNAEGIYNDIINIKNKQDMRSFITKYFRFIMLFKVKQHLLDPHRLDKSFHLN